MENLTVFLFRVAAALFALAGLLPVFRDERPSVVFLVLGVAFLILSLTFQAKQQPSNPESPSAPDDDGAGT